MRKLLSIDLSLKVNNNSLVENAFLCSFLNLAESYIDLCRNFLCQNFNAIRININSEIIDNDTIEKLEKIFEIAVSSRSIVRHNCLTEGINVKINNTQKGTKRRVCLKGESIVNNKCLLLTSSGLDSYACSNMLKRDYGLYHLIINDKTLNKSSLDYFRNNGKVVRKDFSLTYCNSFFNYIDSFDNDAWEMYGQYFRFLVIALDIALSQNIANIAIGLNQDDLFGYDFVDGKIINSQCCQSFSFIMIFKDIIKDIFNINMLIPLENLSRSDVCDYLLSNQISLINSKSCIYNSSLECCKCFSCYDKIFGLLSAAGPSNFASIQNMVLPQFDLSPNKEQVKCLGRLNSLEALSFDYISKVNLIRIIEKVNPYYLLSSKFSPHLLIEVLLLFENDIDLLSPFLGETINTYQANKNEIISSKNELYTAKAHIKKLIKNNSLSSIITI